MPLYEYQCRKCGRRFEKIEKFSATPQTKCEACGGVIARLISVPAIQFKGTGWYITDYARKSDSPEASGNGNGTSKSGSDQTAKSAESKPSESKPSASKSSETTHR